MNEPSFSLVGPDGILFKQIMKSEGILSDEIAIITGVLYVSGHHTRLMPDGLIFTYDFVKVN